VESEVWELFHPSIAPHDGDLRAYLDRVLIRCVSLFDASGASIFLQDGEKTYKLITQLGIQPPIPSDAVITEGEGIAGACLQQGEPLLVHDVHNQIMFSGKQIQTRRHLGSAIVVPLIVTQGESIGVLNVSRNAGEPEFKQPDLSQAASLAHQVALAIATGRLLADSKQTNAVLTELMESIPSAVLSMRADGSVQNANAFGRALAESAPSWLQGEMSAGRFRFTDPDSGEIWKVDIIAAGDGQLIFAENITDESRQAEEEERLRRLAEIGQISARVAHEIRNPLTGIRAAVQMLVEDPSQAVELGDIVDKEVMRLSALCEEFLDMARPAQIVLKPLRMSDLVMPVIRLERPVADLVGIKLHVEGPAKSKYVDMDGNRVQQVLRNLLRNALQACKPGQACTLRYGNDWFEVEDGGCGMSRAAMKNMFVPFFTTTEGGSGLGLSTSKKIVEAHGGNMEVVSEEGIGTTFRVKLGRAA
jgi:signal transduction histidine kinase